MKALTLQKTTLYESLNEIRFLKGVKVCVPDHFCVLVMAGLHYNHTHRRLTVDEFLFKCKRKKKENKTKQKRETNYLLCNDFYPLHLLLLTILLKASTKLVLKD